MDFVDLLRIFWNFMGLLGFLASDQRILDLLDILGIFGFLLNFKEILRIL